VEVREGRLFVDGDRFIVRGVGYDPGSRPGQYPWSRKFDRKVMAADLERMKEAGFNTVRGWSGFNDQELSLIANHDLWVIQGIWFDPSGDFADPEFRTAALRTVSEIVERSAKHDHILMYLVMNEPSAESILKAGEEATREFLTELKTRVNELHPGVPVSFANTIIGDFFDVPAMDVDAFNGYMYAPITMRVLGYRGFLEWWRKNRPAGQPLVVTEFGLSVSPTAKWEGRFSYGGNSPEDQALGNLWMLESLFQAGAQGSCAFLFHDGWWKNANTPDDAMTHDDDPEEWYGIIGIESMDAPMGEPRPRRPTRFFGWSLCPGRNTTRTCLSRPICPRGLPTSRSKQPRAAAWSWFGMGTGAAGKSRPPT
jgi:hypothetical protein